MNNTDSNIKVGLDHKQSRKRIILLRALGQMHATNERLRRRDVSQRDPAEDMYQGDYAKILHLFITNALASKVCLDLSASSGRHLYGRNKHDTFAILLIH